MGPCMCGADDCIKCRPWYIDCEEPEPEPDDDDERDEDAEFGGMDIPDSKY